MSPKKPKRKQQIQRDDQGRLLLNRGPFAKKLILTEEQASELQPLIDASYVWNKSLRRWMTPLIIIVSVLPMVLVGVVEFPYTILVSAGLFALGLVAMHLNAVKQPWCRELNDLCKDLHKNAPRV